MTVKSSIVAQFNITYTQFINPRGELTQPLPAPYHEPETLIQLYEYLVLNRVFDAKVVALQRTGRMGTYPSSLGQEAVGVGVGQAMAKEDVLIPYYRDHGAQLLRGVSMEETLLFWGGDERGCDFAQAREDFPWCIPIGSQSLHAAGVATAIKLRKQQRCAVLLVGDGGTSEGDFYETLNLAGVWQLPLLTVINNNQWAISVPLKEQTHCQTLAQKGIAAGVKGEQVDGDDVVAVAHAVRNALNNIRAGLGPYIIEAITYRMSDHTTADDARRYRTETETTLKKEHDPIFRLRTYLAAQKWWDEEKEKALYARVKKEVDAAAHTYETTPPQPASAIFDYLYARWPEPLTEQRDAFLAVHQGATHA